MMNNEQHKQIRSALMMAALNCGHSIDSDCIILQCDPAKQGNALAQLSGRLLDAYLAAAGASAAPVAPFQVRVQPWMMACFGAAIAADGAERNHRFLEESLELVQACGCTASEAHQLVDYVYGRPVGEPHQEVGGVMVTLAALCLAQSLDMHTAGETELNRIWTKVEAIRAKQAAKPKHSPLPAAAPQVVADERVVDGVLWGLFPGWLIDHCEGNAITEEGLQSSLVDMLNSDEYRAALAAAPVQPVAERVQGMDVPDGWTLVPKEPTIEMIAALGWGGDENLAVGHALISKGIADDYARMLAAAPSQPAIQAPEVGDEPSELEVVIACLGDDAARLSDTEPEVAENMRAAERLLEALTAAPAAQGDATSHTAQIGGTAHLLGEQIFNLATPYFLWTKDGAACDGWQHATAGVVGMPSLLSFARSLADAAIAVKAAS